MAVRRETRDPLSWKATLLWLVVLLALALTLRIAFNVGPSFDGEHTTQYLYSGNDPYYHDRTVNHILDNGESLVFDEAINFPHGGFNPNPPVYDWSTAMVAGFLESTGMDQAKAVSLALNVMVAVWGALTILPVYVIAAELFGRRAGIWAAFLMAVSAPHMQRGMFGFADHDATTMFFITVALAFLVKGLRALDHREYVSDWRHGDARAAGLRAAFSHNKTAFLWSALAGTALAATALTWKGYPYVLGIMGVAIGLQLMMDHARNKDSTALFAFYLIPLLMVAILPYAYYGSLPVFLPSTVIPGLYVLGGVLVLGLILVPTRDLPSIVVFPGLFIAAAVGLVAMFFLAPETFHTIRTGLGYFRQTKLYSTIAEAQRTELGEIAAGFGFFTFLLAFWMFGRSVRRGWKGDEASMLMVAWAVVAFFMAFAAGRFVMNASPVFAIFGGAAVAALVTKLGFGEVRKRFRSQHGQNVIASGARALTWKTTLGVFLLGLVIVLPNLWLGVDAGLPRERDIEIDAERLGAYGQFFDVKASGWLESLTALSSLDTCRSDRDAVCRPGDPDYQPLVERPGTIAWWDYGHYITNLGKHPTVADPFQNHFNLAGRFISSESEHEGIVWLTLLSLDADWKKDGAGYSAEVQAALERTAPGLAAEGHLGMVDSGYQVILPYVEGDKVYEVYDAVTDATGKPTRYFATSERMYPKQDDAGILFAPIFLAGKNPDEFAPIQYFGTRSDGGQLLLTQHQYGMRNNDSYRLDEVRWTDQQGNEWMVYGNQQAFPKGQETTAEAINVRPFISPTERFRNTMLNKAFGGICAADAPAGDGLAHWRLATQATRPVSTQFCAGGQYRMVSIVEYYRGVPVEGVVEDTLGNPVVGVSVSFEDGYGARHATATTDANGTFRVLAPFAVDDDLTLVAYEGDAVLANDTSVQPTREEADQGETVTGVRLVVPVVDLEGVVFRDLNRNGTYENATEETLAGANVTIQGGPVTVADAEGRYRFEDIQPGAYTVTPTLHGYTANQQQVVVAADRNATVKDLPMTAQPSQVIVNATLENGSAATLIPMRLQPVDGAGQPRTATTNETGAATFQSVLAGTYNLTVDYPRQEAGQNVTYRLDTQVTIRFGGDLHTFEVVVAREV